MECEKCGREHNGSYGGGRFCSKECARGFSGNNSKGTKKPRKSRGDLELKCLSCGKVFYSYRIKKYCSKECIKVFRNSDEYILNLSKALKGKNAGEKNGMYGKSPPHTKKIKVISNKHTKCDMFTVRSSYEKEFVDKINKDESIKEFTYEPLEYKVFYIDEEGTKRTYQPDFLVNNEIIEIKNLWNAELEETKIKEKTFKENFPQMKYKILKW